MQGFCILTIFLFSLFFPAQTILYTRKDIDSVKNVLKRTGHPKEKIQLLNQLATGYRYISISEGISCAKEAVELSRKNSFQKEMADSFKCLGKLYLAQQNYSQTMNLYEKAESIYQKLHDNDSYWDIRSETGVVYNEIGEHSKAMEIFFKVLKYYQKRKNIEKIARSYNNIGVVFYQQKNPEKSLEYYNKAYQILPKSPKIKSDIYSKVFTNTGLTYASMLQLEKAEEYYLKSLKSNEEIRDPQSYIVNIGNLGEIYKDMKKYQKAERYFKEAIENSEKIGYKKLLSVNYGGLAIMYRNMAEDEKRISERKRLLDKAIERFQIVLKLYKQNNDLRRYHMFNEELSYAYEIKGDLRKSLDAYKEYMLYKDSVFNDNNSKALARRELVYEFSKKEDSIRLQTEKKIAVKDAVLQANKKQKWLLFLGVFLLSIIGIMLYYQNRNRKKNNEQLALMNKELNEANQIKAKFFGIMNHDLRSPISNIIKLISLQRNKALQLDRQMSERLERKIIVSAENLLSSMEDLLLWSKGQMENFRPQFMEIHVQTLFDDLQPLFDTHDSLKIEYENPENMILITDENCLKTIMRNLTLNALKVLEGHENPEIQWRAFQDSQNKILSITDNGSGGSSEQFRALYDDKHSIGIQSGLGMHLVRDMAKAIGCTVDVSIKSEKGVTISLLFKKN